MNLFINFLQEDDKEIPKTLQEQLSHRFVSYICSRPSSNVQTTPFVDSYVTSYPSWMTSCRWLRLQRHTVSFSDAKHRRIRIGGFYNGQLWERTSYVTFLNTYQQKKQRHYHTRIRFEMCGSSTISCFRVFFFYYQNHSRWSFSIRSPVTLTSFFSWTRHNKMQFYRSFSFAYSDYKNTISGLCWNFSSWETAS